MHVDEFWQDLSIFLLMMFYYIEYVTKAMEAYTKAQDNQVPPAHSVQLALALNFSVFCYEMKKDRDRACELARKVTDHKYYSDKFIYSVICRH